MSQTAEITKSNLDRLNLQERIAAANGFALPPPVFALGTPVVEVGRENFRRMRSEFEALPRAADAFAPFLDRVAAEVRRDVAVRVNQLRLRDDGALTRLDNGGKTLLLDGPKSLRGLLDRTPCEEPGAASTYLSIVPADRRAIEVNEWLRAADPEATAVLRTRLALDPTNGTLDAYGREVFAIVSEKYGTGVEVDVLGRNLAGMIADGLFPGDARGEVTYDGRKAVIRALWHSDIDPADACAGEVFKTGVSVTAADDGTISLNVDGTIWRNLCLNFMIIGTADRSFGSRRHTGSASDLVAWLHDAMGRASRSLRGFAKLWDGGRAKSLAALDVTRDVPEGKTEIEVVQGVFRGLLRGGKVGLPGFRGEAAVVELTEKYGREPEFNRVGIVNAVTRAAHESELRGVFGGEDMEAAGGSILGSARPFQYVEKGGDVF